MDMKIVFLNGDLVEKICMDKSEDFSIKEKCQIVCKLKKLIYRLKQASKQ